MGIEVNRCFNPACAMDRRTLLRSLAALGMIPLMASQSDTSGSAGGQALKHAALRSGVLLSVFTGMHQVQFEPEAAALIANTFGMIADGNDLKFSNRLRPTPDTFDFSFADPVVSWAEQHHLLFRGHCLIWWNALPHWFEGYVTRANACEVLTNHVTTVVKRYAGRVYSWDVVNEPLYPDHRPDGLRLKPWVEMIGPEYIDLAFHTAAQADPKALLVLNECYIEHATAKEIEWRQSFLNLTARLKKAHVPIHAVGIQGHLRGAVPLDTSGLRRFCEQIKDLGLDIMITELDVDDVNVPGPEIEATVARKYKEFIGLMAPYVSSITLEQLNNIPSSPKRPDGFAHMPNLFGADLRPTSAYTAATEALSGKR